MKNLLLLLAAVLCLNAAAQTEKRVALVVGNARYTNSPLTNPVKDARAMAAALREAGFSVMERYDLRYDSLNRVVTEFGRKIKDPDAVALFYFSGHGVQYAGESYLVPIGSDNLRDEEDIEAFCVPVGRITGKMQLADNKLNILVLDACRTFPIAKGTKNLNSGLAEITQTAPQLLVAYATSPGTVAADAAYENNGLFTGALLKYLRTPGYDLHKVFLETRKEVVNRSGGKQRPGLYDEVTSDFFFFPPTTPAPTRTETPVVVTEAPVLPDIRQTYTDPLMGTMVLVKGGTFDMGSANVTLRDYYIGETEVTQRQWRTVMGSDPSYFKNCDDCPVEQVSWNDIQEFLQKLNARSTGARYRLPTEAEWEYAAGGGANSLGYTYAGGSKIEDVAWYDSNSGNKTHPVKEKKANELDLYDMSGNVWEWCADWYGDYPSGPVNNPTGPAEGSFRVLRGGGWRFNAGDCRVAYRYGHAPVFRGSSIGFRVARSPQ